MGAEPVRAMVLWCPDWPIQSVVHAGQVRGGDAIVVVQKGEVFACSAAARREGVRRGLRVREAQARCASLIVLPYSPDLDARAFDPVLTGIEQSIPGVQPIRPGLCTIAARGPSRYYGGERAAAAALAAVAAEYGISDARVGIADGPFAAEQAARRARGGTQIVPVGGSAAFLESLPVEALGDATFATLLKRLGLTTLGAFAELDASAVLDRFGPQGARAHALASGHDVSAVVPRAPQQALERSVAFEPGLDRVDQVTFGFRSTADDFVEAMTRAKLACTAVTVTVESESGAASERTWLHPRWFTAFDVIDRVRWQLQGADAIERGLDSPVVRVTVSPQSVDAIGNHEDGLWGGGPDERIHHALSRVQSMLGHDAVMTGAIGGGRLLAERQVLVPWGDPIPGGRSEPWPGSLPSPLPATVFDPPRPAQVITAAGGAVDVDARGALTGEPGSFSVQGVGAPSTMRTITAWAGPWPVDERWWDATQVRSVQRCHVVDEDGMAWLLMLEQRRWWAEARYD